MLQVARLAPRQLGDAADLVGQFVLGQFSHNGSGGFVDRAGHTDLYYTVFGIECLLALQQDLPTESLRSYLQKFAAGDDLDFIHICCLTHCWAALAKQDEPAALDSQIRQAMANHIEKRRTPDGGYNVTPDAGHGSAYGCFMAYSAYQNLRIDPPDPQAIGDCINQLKQPGGGFANDNTVTTPTTPATAAAVTLQRQLNHALDPQTGQWLIGCQVQGGFLATGAAPMPDLLSTATALHALSSFEIDLEPYRETCLDYVDSLWTNKGAFHGNWADNDLDVEYTYYGLLALGHLSV